MKRLGGAARRARPVRVVCAAGVLLAAAVLPASTAATRGQARKIARDVGASVVNVQVVSVEDGRRVSCASFSGFALAGEPNLIVACCVGLERILKESGGGLEVCFESSWGGSGTLKGIDSHTGVCLIQCSGNPHPPPGVSLARDRRGVLSKGVPVLTVANPFGIERSVRYGVAVGPVLRDVRSPFLSYVLPLAAQRGEEGGAVCSFEGAFLGMIACTSDGGLPMAGALMNRHELFPPMEVFPASAVAAIVAHLKDGRRVLRGTIDAHFVLMWPEGPASVVSVSHVVPDGAAHSAGLRSGDAIREANGRKLDGLNAIYEAALWVEYEGVGKDLVLQVWREGTGPLTLTVPVALRDDEEP